MRDAGITDKDQEFMSSFTDMMTQDNNVPTLDAFNEEGASESSKGLVTEYTPSDSEI